MSFRNNLRHRTLAISALALAITACSPQAPTVPEGNSALSPDPLQPRPIEARETLWIEDMTWMEARDAIAAGRTTILIGTGGIEQNGPYLVSGKHNLAMRALSEAVAAKLGDALIAPIVPFVPQGQIDPPGGHMRYPPTISLREDTYRDLLRDIAGSMRAHGFQTIVFIGDSGGNQPGMADVAAELDEEWAGEGTRVLHIPEFYDWEGRAEWLKGKGYEEVPEGLHDELSVEAILMTLDPNAIRLEERRRAGLASINGVSVASEDEIAALGRGLIDHIAKETVTAIRSKLAAPSI